MLKYFLVSLGCDMNHSDAERISAVLEEIGFQEAKKENEANLVIVVACSVRQTAINKVHGMIHKWKERQKEGEKFVTILTGCVLPKDKVTFEKQFDLLFDIKELPFLPEKISIFFPELEAKSMAIQEYLSITPKYKDPFRSYIPISTGCNQFCTYCAVPYTRGREISRPMEDILSEVTHRVEAGTKIITLLGQNVNSYGLDWEHQKQYKSGIKNHFVELLRRVDETSGDFWVFFYSNHPKDVNDELLEVVKYGKKLCNYLHLPLQAGNNTVLSKMNRRYTKEEYLELVSKVYEFMPLVTLTTDIIVGFPEESAKDFQETREVCEFSRYDMAFIAKYSPRPGSFAARKFSDDISYEEKKERERAINEILARTVLEKNKTLEGKIARVFIDSFDEKKQKYIGRTNGNKKVLVAINPVESQNSVSLRGQFVDVNIIQAYPWALEGELT